MKYWELLVSPIEHQQLILGSDRSELINTASGKRYPVIDEIPVILPPGYVADWANNVLEVLYLDKAMKITQQMLESHGENGFQKAMQEHIQQTFAKSGVESAFDLYSNLPDSERYRCFLFSWAQSQGWAKKLIDDATLARSGTYKTRENGRNRYKRFQSVLSVKPEYLLDYSDAIFEEKPHVVMELGCGSGFSSCVIIGSLTEGQLFFPIDIDYACTANCIGIRRYLSKENDVVPLVASFWSVPFRNDSVDLVCSHLGIDETREVPKVLQEVSRVLKRKGRFVNISKTDPTKHLRYLLGELDFSQKQLCDMARRAGLYAGTEVLLESATKYGLKVNEMTSYTSEDMTKQILFILEKV